MCVLVERRLIQRAVRQCNIANNVLQVFSLVGGLQGLHAFGRPSDGRKSSFHVELVAQLCYSATATSQQLRPLSTCHFDSSMSAVTKGLRRSTSRAAVRRAVSRTAAKRRATNAKTTRPKAKRAAANKPVARKSAKPKALKSKKTAPKKPVAKKVLTPKKSITRKAAPRKAAPRKPSLAKHTKPSLPGVKKTQKLAAVRALRPIAVTPAPPRQPTVDESAALKAFERAHKEFTRGHFGEARNQFRALLEKYSKVSEVAARARTYLAVADSRMRTESILPRDADSLYDRGVIELNRGEYVAAQEMFERALKREPEAAHIHYGLAATRARLGSLDLALQSLTRALDLQPTLRVRAQHDHDLTSLRNDPDFDRLVFQPRL
jgi:tetratricopeptide repeat protein